MHLNNFWERVVLYYSKGVKALSYIKLMTNEGVTYLQQTRYLSKLSGKLLNITRNQLSKLLRFIFAHIMADVLSSSVDGTNHLQVHVDTPSCENMRVVRIDVHCIHTPVLFSEHRI